MSDGTAAAPAQTAPAGENATSEVINKVTNEAGKAPSKGITPVRLKIGDWEGDEAAARSEIERGRQSGKLLTEAQKRLEKASSLEKRFESLKAQVRKSPKAALEALGLSKEEAADVFSRYLYEEEIRPSQMSPEQRELAELKAKLQGHEEEKTKKAETEKQTQFKQQVEQESQKLVKEIQGLLAAKKVPATRVFMSRMAHYLSAYHDNGADIPTERAADLAIEDYKSDFNHFFDESTPEQIEEFLGKEAWLKLASKISKYALAKRKGGVPQPDNKEVVQFQANKRQAREKKTDPNELLRKMSGGVL